VPHNRTCASDAGGTDEEIELCGDSIVLAAALTPGDLEVNASAATEGSPTDNEVLACTVEAQADSVVASDDHLLELERYANIVILPPRRFLDMLNDSLGRKT
jgi:predicted nucleic acid-binding protein